MKHKDYAKLVDRLEMDADAYKAACARLRTSQLPLALMNLHLGLQRVENLKKETLYGKVKGGSVHTYEAALLEWFVADRENIELTHAMAGMAGELGEIFSALTDPAGNVLEELGGLLFYMTLLMNKCGFSLEDVMYYNRTQLLRRHGGKFDTDHYSE